MQKEIKLPSVLTENTHFYKEPYKEQLKPYLGRQYVSYSSIHSWKEYREDFIKQKFVGISIPSGVYADFGSWVGKAIETGEFEPTLEFLGEDNIDLNKYRKPNAEYEKLIIIDRGEYLIIGFIDIYYEENGVGVIRDVKTGGKDKEIEYASKDYIQTILYAYATGVTNIGVHFIRREGSHVNLPLIISKEQFDIENEYSEEKLKYALDKVDKTVCEISEVYKTYLKYLKK